MNSCAAFKLPELGCQFYAHSPHVNLAFVIDTRTHIEVISKSRVFEP